MQTLWFLLTICLVVLASAYDKGIDVSNNNGDIDWQKVKAAGIKFAVAKATEGRNVEDHEFRINFGQIKSNGMQAAAYHYFLGAHPAESQVANVKKVLQLGGFDANNDVLAIDVEERSNEDIPPDAMAEILNDVLVGLNDTYRNIYIYCNAQYWEEKVDWRLFDFSEYKLWIAQYNTDTPQIPSTWRDVGYTWWQYSDRGAVDGIEGKVYLDRKSSNCAVKPCFSSSLLSMIYPSVILV
uniref:Lysozyme n=1 Tax=Graphocephala atropunctata TaxID=36148 RepID=A0A1B6MV01_9HEMI